MNELLDNNAICFWTYVYHFAEEDEKKDHIHFYMVPADRIDTIQLDKMFIEYDLNNPKPIRVLVWRKSNKFGDWYLYNSHNTKYLASKGQKRKYHYSREDFHSSSDEMLNEFIHQIDRSKINSMEIVQDAIDKGISFSSLVAAGQIPVQQIQQFEKAYYICYRLKTVELERNGKPNHEESEEDLPF